MKNITIQYNRHSTVTGVEVSMFNGQLGTRTGFRPDKKRVLGDVVVVKAYVRSKWKPVDEIID